MKIEPGTPFLLDGKQGAVDYQLDKLVRPGKFKKIDQFKVHVAGSSIQYMSTLQLRRAIKELNKKE